MISRKVPKFRQQVLDARFCDNGIVRHPELLLHECDYLVPEARALRRFEIWQTKADARSWLEGPRVKDRQSDVEQRRRHGRPIDQHTLFDSVPVARGNDNC